MTQTCKGDSYTCFKTLTDSLTSIVYVYVHSSVKRICKFLSWPDRTTSIIKFFVRLKKPMPYILTQLMEAYKDKALRPFTIKKMAKLYSEDISKLAEVMQKKKCWQSITHITEWHKHEYCADRHWGRASSLYSGSRESAPHFQDSAPLNSHQKSSHVAGLINMDAA